MITRKTFCVVEKRSIATDVWRMRMNNVSTVIAVVVIFFASLWSACAQLDHSSVVNHATLNHIELGLFGEAHPSPLAPLEKDAVLDEPISATASSTLSTTDSYDNQCAIYLAPSSLKGSDGFGVYAAKQFERNELLLNGPDGPSIAVVDHYDLGQDPTPRLGQVRQAWTNLFDQYWWGRGVHDQVLFEGEVVLDYQIMFGSLPNHHCVLDGLSFSWPDPHYDDQGLNRSLDPGVGAFSYHRGRDFRAGRLIEAGEEIFLNYGYCGDDDSASDDSSWKSNIARNHHFLEVSQILNRVQGVLTAAQRAMPIQQLDTATIEKLLTFVDAATLNSSSIVRSLAPLTHDDFLKVMTTPSSPPYGNIQHRVARYINSIPRTPDWVRKNGLCLDNIIPGKSKIPQAGQGAFAQRHLAAGDVIVPVPLLHIMNRDVLAMYNENGERYSTQLLINYCFGHEESSLLLCPNTNAILINHCSSRRDQCDERGPNAEYRWAVDWDPATSSCLQGTLEEMEMGDHRCVAMEIVALRDIAEGEEIFIDYGAGWERSWEVHLQQWNPVIPKPNFESYFSTKDANHMPVPPDFMVMGDLRAPYVDHPNLIAACLYWTTDFDGDEEWASLDSDLEWTAMSDEDILSYYGSDGSFYEADFDELREMSFWPCTIIRAEDEKHTKFTVRLEGSYWGHYTAWAEKDLPRFITNYPASSILYFNKPYSSDQFLPNAFRHYIEIRDEIFPQHWKNMRV